MIKKLLCITAILMIAALASAPAFAVQLYWNGTTSSSAAVSTGVANNVNGMWTAASVFPDGWSASSAVSSARYNAGGNSRTKAAYNTTAGQAAFAEIEFNVTAAGYWEIAATQSAATLGVGTGIGVVGLNGWVGLPTTTGIFSTGNVYNTMGTYKTTSLTPKIRFNEAGQTQGANRWYLDQIRLTSATPGAATLVGPADGSTVSASTVSLNWAAGAYSSFFDVYFGDTSGSLMKIMDNVSADTISLSNADLFDLYGPLAGGTQYFWRVDAKNVDIVTAGSEWNFFTEAVPEPGSMLALGTGLIGLLGMIRRKRA